MVGNKCILNMVFVNRKLWSEMFTIMLLQLTIAFPKPSFDTKSTSIKISIKDISGVYFTINF